MSNKNFRQKTTRKRSSQIGSDAQGVPIQSWQVLAVYWVSGIPAIIYQAIWQRLLVLPSGVGAVSIAIIVTSFLIGMGVGSWLGAKLSTRWSPRKAILVFAAIELSIGTMAVVSPYVLHEVLYLKLGWIYEKIWVACWIHCATLFLPTAMMGATFPLITRAFVRESDTAAKWVSSLYGINMLGGALGAILGPWLLIPFFGIQGSVSVGAAINVCAAAMGLYLSRQLESQVAIEPKRQEFVEDASSLAKQPARDHFRRWILLYFMSGWIAIGLEMVWFRIMDVAAKSTSFTFGTVLSVYLAMMAFGSMLGARWKMNPEQAFVRYLTVQWLVLIFAAAPILLIVSGLSFGWLEEYWGESLPLNPSWERFYATSLIYGILPLGLFGVSTFLMGIAFHLLQSGVQIDSSQASYRVGMLQASNILGCALGGLVIGLLGMEFLGTMMTLRILLGSGILFAVSGVAGTTQKPLFAMQMGLLLLVLFLLPQNDRFWLRLHGHPVGGPLVLEDATGVAALTPEKDGLHWKLSANGKSQSSLPFGKVHCKLGALPVTLHPMPKEVAIIGLGSGGTAWAAACRKETESLTVFEIFQAEHNVLEKALGMQKWPKLEQVLRDPRIEIRTRDARHALMTDEKLYDVIEADAIRPTGAYAGYLYSVEFFQLCSKRLKPDGLMCTWAPTIGTYATFAHVFPFVLELDGGSTLIGSKQPIRFDPRDWGERLGSRELTDYLSIDVVAECRACIDRGILARPMTDFGMLNTDLFPYDEYHEQPIK